MSSCSICSNIYTKTDLIVSTDCGHVFHGQCLRKLHQEEKECPRCFAVVKTITKIILHFETAASNKDVQISELKSTISHLYSSTKELQDQLKVNESKLQNIQSQLSLKEIAHFNLQKNFEFLTCENNKHIQDIGIKNAELLKIQLQYNKIGKELNQANKQIELLQMEKEDMKKQIENKTIEVQHFKENNKNRNPILISTALEEEIRVLKEKNKQISLKLANEVRNSTRLEIEKNILEEKNETNQQLYNDKEKKSDVLEDTEKATENLKSAQQNNENATEDSEVNSGGSQSLIIRNVNEKFANEKTMKEYIFKLLNLMDVSFVEDDILEVSFLKDKKKNKTSLLVYFKNYSLKKKFFNQKHKLKMNPGTKKLYIQENLNVCLERYKLYQYAKSLESLGFQKVYRENNIVFVKKSNDSEAIRISSRSEIDNLKCKA